MSTGSKLVGDNARCSSVPEDLDSEREALAAAGVAADRIYLDVGLSGINRPRPALGEAMAACWAGSRLVITVGTSKVCPLTA